MDFVISCFVVLVNLKCLTIFIILSINSEFILVFIKVSHHIKVDIKNNLYTY